MVETAILTDKQGVALVIRGGTYLEGVFVADTADAHEDGDLTVDRGDKIIGLLGGDVVSVAVPYTLRVDGRELEGQLYRPVNPAAVIHPGH